MKDCPDCRFYGLNRNDCPTCGKIFHDYPVEKCVCAIIALVLIAFFSAAFWTDT